MVMQAEAIELDRLAQCWQSNKSNYPFDRLDQDIDSVLLSTESNETAGRQTAVHYRHKKPTGRARVLARQFASVAWLTILQWYRRPKLLVQDEIVHLSCGKSRNLCILKLQLNEYAQDC